MKSKIALLMLLFFCSVHAKSQIIDTLDLLDPQDFYFTAGDSMVIHLKTDLDSLSLSFDKKGQDLFHYDDKNKLIRFTSGNDKLEHLIHIVRGADTVKVINFYPAVDAEFRKGFGRYNVAKIMDESSYFEIKIDSSTDKGALRINGRKLVFENKPGNLFYKYSYREGQTTSLYKKVEIGADTLVIRDRIHFPFSQLLVNARVLIIEYNGNLPAIDITPVKTKRKIPGDKYERGENGRDGDTLSVYFHELIYNGARSHALFASNGGDGQDAPYGKHGIDYPKLTPASPKVVMKKTKGDAQHCNNLSTSEAALNSNDPRTKQLVRIDFNLSSYKAGGSAYHGSDWETTCVYTGSNNHYGAVFSDIHIKRALPLPGGFPGEPGRGGVINSNHDISHASSVTGGRAGKLDTVRTSGKIYGPEEIWMLNVTQRYNRGKLELNDYAYTKLNYPQEVTVQPKLPQRVEGDVGNYVIPGAGKPWLNLNYVKFIVDYANDLFRFGNVPEAEKILAYYQQQFFGDTAIRRTFADNILFLELNETVNHALTNIAGDVDYYGNKYGFVPGTDIVTTSAVYAESIDRLTKAYAACLYLEKHIEKGTYQYEQAVLEIEKYLAANLNFEQEFQDIENIHIPFLEDKIDTTIAYLKNIAERVKKLEAEFDQKASATVRKREREAKKKSFLKSIATLAKVVPVGQPYLGIGASALETILYREKGESFLDQVNNVLDDYGKIKESKEKFATFSKKVNDALTNSPADLPVYKKLYNNKDTLLKYVEPYMKSTEALLAGLKTEKVSKESVAAEIAKLKARHPQYTTFVDSVQKLTELNGELVQGLLTLQTKLRVITKSISYNSKVIDDIKADLSTTNLPEAERLNSLSVMKKEIIDRLNYFQYFYARAYEYFTLKQYRGYERTFYWLKGDKLRNYTNYEELVSKISALYLADASEAALAASSMLNADLGNVGETTKTSLIMTSSDIERLNKGETLSINFFRDNNYNVLKGQMAEFEDLLIEDIDVIPVYNLSSLVEFKKNNLYPSSVLEIRHQGTSHRYGAGTQYDFYHASTKGSPFYEWVFDKSFVTNELVSREIDETYLGLINVLTSGKIQRIRKNVSFDSYFDISKKDRHPESMTVQLDSLKVTFRFLLVPRGETYSVHLYDQFAGPSDVPLTIVSHNRVFKGNGFLYQTFQKNEAITVSAPLYWEDRTFAHWIVNDLKTPGDNVLSLKVNKKLISITPVYR